ncbi:MAG: hypothetical protein AB7R89_34680 [Dehalococcoidia bacterium]
MPNLPEQPQKQPPHRPWAVLVDVVKPVLLTAIAMAGLVIAWSGLGPTGFAAISPNPNAGGSSAMFPGSIVTPVTFAEVATLIAYAQPSPDPLGTMVAMPVYLAEVTPTPYPTLPSATATYEALMQAARDANATATAAARPRSCYESIPSQNTVCFWPSPTATMPPPLPTLPPCLTPVVGELCLLYGAVGSGTPLPVILDILPGVPR